MPPWVPVDDSQTANWNDVSTLGFLLLETGLGNYLIQETAPAPYNRFYINTPLPVTVWTPINDSQ
jgi:hypothetical protein